MLISPNPVSAGLLLFRRQPALEIYIGHMGGPFWEQKDRGAWSKSAIDKPESEDQFCRIALTNSPSGSKKNIPLF